jgi:hypothetical protein
MLSTRRRGKSFQTRHRKWTVPIVTRTVTDLEDIKALDPFVRIIELPG